MPVVSRRNLLKAGTVIPAVSGGIVSPARAADRAGSKYNFGHTEDFGVQYYDRITCVIESVRRTEMDLIGDISSRMADRVKAGGEVWLQAAEGHMGRFENDETLPGHSGAVRSIPMHVWNGSEKERVAALKKGDVLVTCHVNETIRDARDRGVYVVGVPVCYVDNEWTPRGFVRPHKDGWLLGDVSSVILQSYVPYTQGIVDCPQIPELKILPSSSNALFTLYWMFQCEVANKVKNRRAGHIDKSRIVIDTILERIHDAYHLQKDYMFDHAATVAKAIGGGAHYHVTSDNPGVQEESNRVANGPMMTNAFRRIVRFDGKVIGTDDMRAGDVHLLAANEPDARPIVEEAKKARDMGTFVVTIAPGGSYELRRLSDVFIDNFCPEGTGLMEIEGYDRKIGSIGSVMNNMLMWIFTAQFIDEMVRRGRIPWFYLGYHQIGGAEYDTAIRQFFEKQGF